MMQFLSFSFAEYAFGKGWYPAIINSDNELNFLEYAQRGFLNDTSYWIGGSTDSNPFNIIRRSAYRTDSAGHLKNLFY